MLTTQDKKLKSPTRQESKSFGDVLFEEIPEVEKEEVGRGSHRFVRDKDEDDQHVADHTDRQHETEEKTFIKIRKYRKTENC